MCIRDSIGTAQQRIKALFSPGDVWVISRDNLPWLCDYLRQSWRFDMVVLDESTSFKNSQSKRFKALKMVRSRISRVVALTGTPSPNVLMDLWAQVYLCLLYTSHRHSSVDIRPAPSEPVHGQRTSDNGESV